MLLDPFDNDMHVSNIYIYVELAKYRALFFKCNTCHVFSFSFFKLAQMKKLIGKTTLHYS